MLGGKSTCCIYTVATYVHDAVLAKMGRLQWQLTGSQSDFRQSHAKYNACGVKASCVMKMSDEAKIAACHE